MIMIERWKHYAPTLAVFAIITLLFFYKLDYHYFFTDEILYRSSGIEYLKGEYSLNLQHPLIGKYIVGFATLFDEMNVFIMRTPYAILGILSAFIVYKILGKWVGESWGLFGAMVFTTSQFIFDATRMVMFESPMHFFWLLFSFYLLKVLENLKKEVTCSREIVLSGLFLGLAMATKHTSIVLVATVFFAILFAQGSLKTKAINFLKISVGGALVFGLTYLHFFFSRGLDGAVELAKTTYFVFFGRNSEGKDHVVAGQVYNKSPQWFYLHYIYTKYNPLGAIAFFFSPVIVFFKGIGNFERYWLLLLGFSTFFSQALPLKNARYLASIEVPLVFLFVVAVKYVWDLSRGLRLLTVVFVALNFINFFIYLVMLKPTEYHGLYNYLSEKTQNFSNGERAYVYGSIRSMKWYRNFVAEEHLDNFLYRKDFYIMCPEFDSFKYIAFDKEELQKNPDILLFEYVEQNREKFAESEIADMQLFTRINNEKTNFICQEQESE